MLYIQRFTGDSSKYSPELLFSLKKAFCQSKHVLFFALLLYPLLFYHCAISSHCDSRRNSIIQYSLCKDKSTLLHSIHVNKKKQTYISAFSATTVMLHAFNLTLFLSFQMLYWAASETVMTTVMSSCWLFSEARHPAVLGGHVGLQQVLGPVHRKLLVGPPPGGVSLTPRQGNTSLIISSDILIISPGHDGGCDPPCVHDCAPLSRHEYDCVCVWATF